MAMKSAAEAEGRLPPPRAAILTTLLMLPALCSGCSLDRSALSGAVLDGGSRADTGMADAELSDIDAHIAPVDAYVRPGDDAALDAFVDPRDGGPADAYMPDAFRPDAYVPPDAFRPDAYVPPDAYRPDAYVPPDAYMPDAYVPPDAFRPDAYVPPDAYMPDAYVPPDAWVAPCVAGATRCVSATTLERCDGTAWIPEPCALGCSAVGGAHCAVMVPSNVDPTLTVGTVDVTTAGATTWNTDACASLPGTSMRIDQLAGPGACLMRVRDLVVASGSTVRVTGSLPLIVVAQREIRIDGSIDVSAVGVTAGPGGGDGAGAGVGAGGPSAGAGGAHSGTYSDGGGAGGGMCGGGGGGGAGGSAAGGSPSGAVTTDLSPLIGGSGGGRGGTGQSAGEGGAGGGALQLSAFGAVRISGNIYAGGGGGRGGRDARGSDPNIGAGGGGGSGGAVLIESPTIDFTGLLRASGAGGGGAAGCRFRGDADPGQDGAATSGLPSGGRRGSDCVGGENYGAPGGAGGADATLGGGAGVGNTTGGANGGGGGGGAGCIVFRRPGPSTGAGGTTSPSVAPGVRVLALRTM